LSHENVDSRLALPVRKIIVREGISQAGQAAMEEFMGDNR